MSALYIHVPFDRSSHKYDEHYAITVAEAEISLYERALREELETYAEPCAAEDPISTVYLGGSRPSLLPIRTVHSILSSVWSIVPLSTVEETTVELNPTDVQETYVQRLHEMGVNRINLPVLSFLPGDLAAIDAPHSSDEAFQAIETVMDAGIGDISVDLLFGWPDHSFSNWNTVLQKTVELQIPHVSIIEAVNGTDFDTSEDALAERIEHARTVLQSEGYEQYELTHFALPGFRSTHQQHYSAHENYLGVGPSAESFWWPDRSQSGLARRWANVADLNRYESLLQSGYPPVRYNQTLRRTALAQEYLLLRLRTTEGIDLDHLAATYDYDLRAENGPLLDRLQTDGLLEIDERTLRLTDRGRLLSDAITERLSP